MHLVAGPSGDDRCGPGPTVAKRPARSGISGSFASPWATSMRNPSTPRSSQNRSTTRTRGAPRRWSSRGPAAPRRTGGGTTARVRPAVREPASTPGHRRRDCQSFGGCIPEVAAPGSEQVASPLRGAGRRGERLGEPRVLVRGVVGHQVHDQSQPEGVRCRHELVERVEVPEERIDLTVVRHVVAGVDLRRRIERVQPDGVDAEVRDVGQPPR